MSDLLLLMPNGMNEAIYIHGERVAAGGHLGRDVWCVVADAFYSGEKITGVPEGSKAFGLTKHHR